MFVPAAPTPAPARRPLVVTGSPVVREDLARLSAAAGAEPDVAHDPSAARAGWVSAPIVVAGGDALAELVRLNLPRRPTVVIVSTDAGTATTYEDAIALGAERVVLMRGHGFSAAGRSLPEAIRIAVYMPLNARVLSEALRLGEVTALSRGEIEAHASMRPDEPSMYRAWEYWAVRAGCRDLLTART